jgi:hypothetical protein
MMKLKTYKTSTKGLRLKIRNQKNRHQSWNTNNQEGQIIIFGGREREEEKK